MMNINSFFFKKKKNKLQSKVKLHTAHIQKLKKKEKEKYIVEYSLFNFATVVTV